MIVAIPTSMGDHAIAMKIETMVRPAIDPGDMPESFLALAAVVVGEGVLVGSRRMCMGVKTFDR